MKTHSYHINTTFLVFISLPFIGKIALHLLFCQIIHPQTALLPHLVYQLFELLLLLLVFSPTHPRPPLCAPGHLILLPQLFMYVCTLLKVGRVTGWRAWLGWCGAPRCWPREERTCGGGRSDWQAVLGHVGGGREEKLNQFNSNPAYWHYLSQWRLQSILA